MPDLSKTLWQDVLFKTSQKLRMGKRYYFLLVPVCIILVLKTYLIVIYFQDPLSSDSHFMRITAPGILLFVPGRQKARLHVHSISSDPQATGYFLTLPCW